MTDKNYIVIVQDEWFVKDNWHGLQGNFDSGWSNRFKGTKEDCVAYVKNEVEMFDSLRFNNVLESDYEDFDATDIYDIQIGNYYSRRYQIIEETKEE